MKNTIRCFISCILPCGALDVIRIVHANGEVEEITGTIRAAEIMKAHPKHVLKKPSSSSNDGVCPKIMILPPDEQLQRGKIYFLMPVPSKPVKTRSRSSTCSKKKRDAQTNSNNNNNNNSSSSVSMTNFLVSDRYLSEILSEKLSTHKDLRRGRVGVWRPHLESIFETPSEA
ncbi:uncharacterized protein LOC132311550 [Cornus florida]|uniref:uncharacterized protein LOC132311550 n=1 Tax=Cornus florida TaxID=4283 RepID=UPI00289F7992|nr:uncharacterized protein LOC132311550 [Cornus florida]